MSSKDDAVKYQEIKQAAENLGKFAELVYTLSNDNCECKLQTNSKGEAYFDAKARAKDPKEATAQVKIMIDEMLQICQEKNIPVAGMTSK